ncbi:hypothetical protein F4780DRAFT_775793 [Xylariomycetidae sp. FL0641]|nr:hypothetical protein F4780DRAFT_775793 [Xylariomycetidae sp. FL0641]
MEQYDQATLEELYPQITVTPDSNWTAMYVVLGLIPLVFVGVAVYSRRRDHRRARRFDAEMARVRGGGREQAFFPWRAAVDAAPRSQQQHGQHQYQNSVAAASRSHQHQNSVAAVSYAAGNRGPVLPANYHVRPDGSIKLGAAAAEDKRRELLQKTREQQQQKMPQQVVVQVTAPSDDGSGGGRASTLAEVGERNDEEERRSRRPYWGYDDEHPAQYQHSEEEDGNGSSSSSSSSRSPEGGYREIQF